MRLTRWLSVFLPTAALIVLVFYGYGHQSAQAEHDRLSAHERTALELAAGRLQQYLSDAVDDVRVLYNTPAVRDFVDTPTPETRARAEALFAAFIRAKFHYAQLRVLDHHGLEIVRVVRSPDGARSQSDPEMQSKQGRDYVIETLAAAPGVVRVSRLDLNIEKGGIERPINPVLRLSVRLQSARGEDYLLVANLRGAVMLRALNDVMRVGAGEPWVLDAEGYWLSHPDLSRRWGAQLDRRQRLELVHPPLVAMLERDAGELSTEDGLYLFQRFDPGARLAAAEVINAARFMVLAAHLPREALPSALPPRLMLPMLAVLALAALGTALLLGARTRAMVSERREQQLLAEQTRAQSDQLWVRDELYRLSLRVHAATDTRAFAEAALAQLAPALGLAAGALYAVDEHERCVPLAGLGLSSEQGLRGFESGEGLIGEAVRTRTERRITPPPAGYLDLVGGAGTGPAADLRVLPLWVHGRSVGVIELAFLAPLDARQEDLLRQLLPLLAINLDGLHRKVALPA